MQKNTPADLVAMLSERGIDSVEKLNDLFSPGQFAVVPMEIMERGDLTPNAKLLYAEITGLSRIGGFCFAKDKYIAGRLGITIRSVQRLMDELVAKNLIRRETTKSKRGTFRKIFLTWDGGVRQDCQGGMTEMTYPVRQTRRTKREIQKEKYKIDTPGAQAPEKKQEDFILLMDAFKKSVNPTLNFGNKTERKAAQQIIDDLGTAKAMEAVQFAISIQGQRYAPVITTPYALAMKMGDLRVFYRRKMGDNGTGSVAVI